MHNAAHTLAPINNMGVSLNTKASLNIGASIKTVEPVWYRQFWPWFLIGLLGTAVAATLIMLIIAMHNADSSVHDAFSKTGFAIDREQTASSAAIHYRLQGAGAIDAYSGAIALALHGQLTPATLTLAFIHPFASANDFSIALQKGADGIYRGQLPRGLAGRWLLELGEIGARTWQLNGIVDLQISSVFALRP
jgi:hypothetical protein